MGAVKPKRDIPVGVSFISHPRALLELPDISLQEERILAEVLVLQKNGGCYASNDHLGNLARVKTRQVSNLITSLEKAGHLIIKNRSSGKRRMWVSNEITEGSSRDTPSGTSASAPVPGAAPAPEPKPAKKERATPKKNPTIKDHAECELPDYVPRAEWRAFVEMKHNEHGPFTPIARNGVLGKLKRLHEDGYDCTKLLKTAVEECWKSVWDRPDCKRVGSGDRRQSNIVRLPNGAMIVDGKLIQ